MLRKQRRGASSAEASEAPADRMRGGTACPSCGAPLSPGSAFCPACGVRLDSAYDAAEAAARANSRKSRKRAAKEAERAAGKRAVLCTNDLAGFELMFCDGTAEVVPGVFSRTVEFGDVNYENERRDVQDAIYERMCQLHASFNAGTSYQMTLVNYPSRTVEVEAYLEEVGPTADIARAFLVTESAMTRRLTRAKAKIAQAGIPYRVPAGATLTVRLPGVLAVLYLLFTQGYNADGEPAFADEAIRLARLVERLMPGRSEVSGLLALFLFQHSRRHARRDDDGNLLTLDRQDRSRWDHAAIAEGFAALDRAGADGPYVLQARIAACHAAGETDWAAVAGHYDRLAALQASPVVLLNRAVAHGYAYGAAAGLVLLTEARTGGALDGYPPAVAAEAELTARAGDRIRAELLFREAADLATAPAERRALLMRAAEM